MNIKLIRLRSEFNYNDELLISENNNFIEEINNELIDDDFSIQENPKDSICSIVFVETGGVEMTFLKIIDQLERPILLLSNQKNNSLPACLEIKSYCHQNEISCLLAQGDEKTISRMIKHYARVKYAQSILNNSNLGIIGKPSDWLISSNLDYKIIYDKYKINLVDIGIDELLNEIKKKNKEKMPHYDRFVKKFNNIEDVEKVNNIYLALKRLVKKYKLSGLTIRCFDLIKEYKSTACLALGLLNEEGITSACEGDIPSLLTMYLIRVLTGNSSFQANPSIIDTDNNTVLLAHCSVPLNMVDKYELLSHFESGIGIGIKGNMPLGDVSICKLVFNKDYTLEDSLLITGTIKENCSLPGFCRTQIKVELNEYDAISLLKENYGNHLIVCYREVINDIFTYIAFNSKEIF